MAVYLVNGQLVQVDDQAAKRLLVEYSGDKPLYLGTAAPDAATSDPVWTIKKFSFSGENVTSIQARINTAWNNRATPTPPWE